MSLLQQSMNLAQRSVAVLVATTALVVAAKDTTTTADKVKVTLFEESLCPSCIGYFDAGTDLQPVNIGFWMMYTELRDIVEPEVHFFSPQENF